ncbi:MAG: cellulase family glycosylhydrolase [Deltaproteobacteria bacterium]|jgi:endoglycosylceramidase|nr:cellulase family glycosylhydrolase [Deltaproteobacteria bacterium]MBW2536455.1 cellulase family glycosylhydrolase [Deltaproteobacteria bacterium]
MTGSTRGPVGLALLLAAGCGGDDEPVAPTWPDRWHVADAIRDRQGRSVVLRGVNVANEHKQAPYLGFHQPEDYARIRDAWGMNSVRFLLTWAAVEPARGELDADYLAALVERIRWAGEAGLWVVLDMHQDVYGEGFGGDGAPRWTCDEEHYQAFEPTSPWFMNYADEHVVACFDQLWGSAELREHFADAWAAVAAALVDEPAVIGFDVINEPYWGSQAPTAFEAGALSDFHEQVVARVREHAPAWLAFVEPSAGRNLGIPTSLRPFAFDDAVYAPHSYDAAAESGEGFDPAGRNGLILRLGLYAEEARSLGAALWIGEYGGNPDDPGITEYMDAQYDGAAAVAASTMYWAYDRDDGYGLLRPDGAEKPLLLDVLVRPYPERVAGSLLEYHYDEQQRRLTVRYEADERVSAPTVIRVPARVYPSGVTVQCGGCQVDERPGEVLLSGGPESGEVAVEISPR